MGLSADAEPTQARYRLAGSLFPIAGRNSRDWAGVGRVGYSVLRWVIRQYLRALFGLSVTGEANVPAAGPVIFAANHASQMDPIVLEGALPRRCAFLAAAELLTMPVLGALVRPFHPVPINRRRFDRRAIRACLDRLGRGEALSIFPEAKISTDGKLQAPRDGLAFIAYHAGVPVIPIGVRGTYQVWPLGTRVPHRGKITVHIGTPIFPKGTPTRENQAALTSRLMDAIAGLAGARLHPGWPGREDRPSSVAG